jgi:hypothetical protein
MKKTSPLKPLCADDEQETARFVFLFQIKPASGGSI